MTLSASTHVNPATPSRSGSSHTITLNDETEMSFKSQNVLYGDPWPHAAVRSSTHDCPEEVGGALVAVLCVV